MARQREDRDAIIAELKEAVVKYGPEAGPKIVRERHPEVVKQTWHRWLSEVKATPIDAAIRDAQRAVAEAGAYLPAPPCPAVMAQRPVESRRALDVMAKVDRLEGFAEDLVEYSSKAGAAGRRDIKNPHFHVQAAKLYDMALQRRLEACGLLYEWQRMQNFYDAIVEEIRQCDPEVARRIMDRLAALDRERGFTFTGRPA